MTVLCAEALTGGYGGMAVVHDVDLEVRAGSCTAILGPNGAGKSTLLRLLAGLLPATAGTVRLQGRPLTAWRRREIAQRLGYLPQWIDFSFPLTVEEVVEQGRAPHLGPWRPASPRDRAAVRKAMERLGLLPLARRPVRSLSGGERQRVLLARALASEPLAILLDEPSTALDVRHQLELAATLGDLLRQGTSLILVVHDWNLGLALAEEVILLKDGRVVARGAPAAVRDEALFRAVFGVEVRIVRDDPFPPRIVPTGLG